MIWQLSDTVALVIDVTILAVAGVVVGYLHHRLPAERLAEDGPITRLRGWESDGEVYDRWLRIRRWKDRLPEAGATFRGGVSKRALPAADRAGLVAFARETRRAERVHWSLLALAPLFVLWSPPVLAASMVAYTLAANVPFILIQRFNRGRLLRALRRPVRTGRPATAPTRPAPSDTGLAA